MDRRRLRGVLTRTAGARSTDDEPTSRSQRPPRPSLVGTVAPAVAGHDPSGAVVERLWSPAPRTLVAFLTGGCRECQPFWTALTAATEPVGSAADVLLVTPSPSTESRRGIAARAGTTTAVIMSSEAWFAYGVPGAPWFVVVDAGSIESESYVSSWDRLLAMLRP